jgi:hypothetical protein
MRIRKWLKGSLVVALGVAAVVSLIGWGVTPVEAQSKRGHEPTRHDRSLEGQPAPEFNLSDVYGMPHSLSVWRGMPIFLHFGSSW